MKNNIVFNLCGIGLVLSGVMFSGCETSRTSRMSEDELVAFSQSATCEDCQQQADALASGDGSSAGNSRRRAALEELAKRCCEKAEACGIPRPKQCDDLVENNKDHSKSIEDIIADYATDVISKEVLPPLSQGE